MAMNDSEHLEVEDRLTYADNLLDVMLHLDTQGDLGAVLDAFVEKYRALIAFVQEKRGAPKLVTAE